MSSPHTLESLARTPNSLVPHYARFRVSERLLLTGHSHQAWPDVGLEGQLEAWTDAAAHVDDKWERAAQIAARFRRGYARLTQRVIHPIDCSCTSRSIRVASARSRSVTPPASWLCSWISTFPQCTPRSGW